MPDLPARALVDADTDLPEMGRHAFWFQGSAWEVPDFDNAEAFVNRLVRDGLLVRAPVVDAVLHRELTKSSLRTAQRHFVRTTGLTHGAVRRIERARYATTLLQAGCIDSRRRSRGGVLRPAASHPIAEAPHWPDAGPADGQNER